MTDIPMPPIDIPVSSTETGKMDPRWYRYLFQQFGANSGSLTDIDTRVTTLETSVTDSLFTVVEKLTDQSRSSDNTLADDNTLTFPVSANTLYNFKFVVFYATTIVADFQYQFTGPAAPTLIRYLSHTRTFGDSTEDFGHTIFSDPISLTSASATSGAVITNGSLSNGVNAGNVTLQWAQDSTDAANTTVFAGSYLQYRAVS